jgi:hypothetical protein
VSWLDLNHNLVVGAGSSPSFVTHTAPTPQVFKALHSAYVDAASNPFFTVGLPLTAPSFAGEVAAVVRGYAQQLAQP